MTFMFLLLPGRKTGRGWAGTHCHYVIFAYHFPPNYDPTYSYLSRAEKNTRNVDEGRTGEILHAPCC